MGFQGTLGTLARDSPGIRGILGQGSRATLDIPVLDFRVTLDFAGYRDTQDSVRRPQVNLDTLGSLVNPGTAGSLVSLAELEAMEPPDTQGSAVIRHSKVGTLGIAGGVVTQATADSLDIQDFVVLADTVGFADCLATPGTRVQDLVDTQDLVAILHNNPGTQGLAGRAVIQGSVDFLDTVASVG